MKLAELLFDKDGQLEKSIDFDCCPNDILYTLGGLGIIPWNLNAEMVYHLLRTGQSDALDEAIEKVQQKLFAADAEILTSGDANENYFHDREAFFSDFFGE